MTGCFGHNLVLAAFHGGVLVGSDSGAEFNSGDAQDNSQRELSENDKLKQELERQELQTQIAKKRLEEGKINQQLSQMKNSDSGIQSENVSASVDDCGVDVGRQEHWPPW